MTQKFLGSVKSNLWPPLVDGTYAIVLTLLVIELPTLTFELLHGYNHEELGQVALYASLLRLIGGYLGVFLIVYDIWTKKRLLLEISNQHFRASGFENFVVLISLFLSTLIPPLHYVYYRCWQDYFSVSIVSRPIWLEKVEVNTIVIAFVIDIIIVYCLILLAVSMRCHQIRISHLTSLPDQAIGADLFRVRAELVALRQDLAARILIAIIFTPVAWNWLHPPLPSLIYGLSGLWHTKINIKTS